MLYLIFILQFAVPRFDRLFSLIYSVIKTQTRLNVEAGHSSFSKEIFCVIYLTKQNIAQMLTTKRGCSSIETSTIQDSHPKQSLGLPLAGKTQNKYHQKKNIVPTRPCLDPFSFRQFLRIWLLKTGWDPNRPIIALSSCHVLKNQEAVDTQLLPVSCDPKSNK